MEQTAFIEWLAEYGYIGLFFGAMLAATIVPLSSDVMMVALLTTGADPATAVVAATLGNCLGGLTSYGLGYLGKWEWIEKWFKVTEEKLEKQRGLIQRYGAGVAFFSWLPFVGDLLLIGLGFYRINFKKTLLLMCSGRALRFIVWGVAYHYFGAYFTDWLSSF
jgi:membrane protein YqaA with SNARE-associated domain